LSLLNQAKKFLVVTNIRGHLPSLFLPFQVTPNGLKQMDRHHRTQKVQFSFRTILEDALAESIIKLLKIYEKNIDK
jgi:hypothetical protein